MVRRFSNRSWRVGPWAAALLLAGLPATSSAQDARPIAALLDDYLAGRHDAAVAGLVAFEQPGAVLTQLRSHGPSWIDAADDAAAVDRRRLAAATLALEAARLYLNHTWKTRTPHGDGHTLEWHPTPLLIEWGCELLRSSGPPSTDERIWQVAATGLAIRAGDHEFLMGDARVLNNPSAIIGHLHHARVRFPDEPRLKLAEAMLVELRSYPAPGGGGVPVMRRALQQLQDDQDVGAEATLRLGYSYARQQDDGRAIPLFDRADVATRDPWLMYLARYFKGRSLERQRQFAEAEAAYRQALDVMPSAPSATLALAARLAESSRGAEAAALVAATTAAHQSARDPWREYMAGDDRFWPQLAARLRERIAR